MNGDIPLEAVYGERLALIRPTLQEIAALSREYIRTLAPGADAVIRRLREAGVEIVLVSGGIRRAIEPVALTLGLARDDLFAVELAWNADGEYTGFDTDSPLTSQSGKLQIVESLNLSRPRLAVGDGATDAAMRNAVDVFAAYTGFARRENVVSQADVVFATFDDLSAYVIG